MLTNIVLADPATRYDGKVEHIIMSKEAFIKSWHSQSDLIPGIYIATFPSQEKKDELETGLLKAPSYAPK